MIVDIVHSFFYPPHIEKKLATNYDYKKQVAALNTGPKT